MGGRYGTADPPVLVVRVVEPAVDGRANQACLEALAKALDVPKRAITIVAGTSSRTKMVEVEGGDPQVVSDLLRR